MKNPMGYGPQNFNPMYGGHGFNPQQMAMYGPGRQAPMQQGWNPNMRQPMMPGGFRAPMPPYNSMMGMPRTAPVQSILFSHEVIHDSICLRHQTKKTSVQISQTEELDQLEVRLHAKHHLPPLLSQSLLNKAQRLLQEA